MEIETQCLYAGYSPKNGEPQTLPICQSTTFKYESTEQVSKLFDLEEAGFFYTRLGNPTVDAVEQKIAMLEGGVGALCTASGQAATTFSILTLAAAGDHIVSSSAIYGGSLNLFAVTLKRLGIEVTFVSPEASEEEIQAAFRPNTKALFGDFVRELGRPDITLLAEIYAAREKNTLGISSKDLAERIPGAEYCATLDDVKRRLEELAKPGDLILTVGAGDIYTVGEAMVKDAESETQNS